MPGLKERAKTLVELGQAATFLFDDGPRTLDEAAAKILQSIPGIALVDLNQPAVGLQSVSVGALPAFKRELQLKELQAADDAGIDALVKETKADELIVVSDIYDHPTRLRSFEMIADAAK